MENFNDTLDSLEKALEENTINEGQYIKLMDMAKKRFEKQNKDKDDDDDDFEIIEIQRHNDFFLGRYENINEGNYIVINLIEWEEDNSTGYRNFLRQSDAEVYYRQLAGI